MGWGQVLAVQGGALALLLSILGFLARAMVKGTIVSGRELADVRKDRDERVAAAELRAKEWRELYAGEHEAHNTTRAGYADEIRAALLASSEGAQVGVQLLREIRGRQIEAANHDPAA
ncbi:hypothetical protein J5X84_36075 [Streptosporangiaceae bacterium NEAU-GS5]|nr:hypothetical protein [Streptosporangiaceae bacterium NEAU-GS5]